MQDSTLGVVWTGVRRLRLWADMHARVNPRAWDCASCAHDPVLVSGSRDTRTRAERGRRSPRLPQGWHWVAIKASGTPCAGAAKRVGDGRANGAGEADQARTEGQQDVVVRITAILLQRRDARTAVRAHTPVTGEPVACRAHCHGRLAHRELTEAVAGERILSAHRSVGITPCVPDLVPRCSPGA
jgi:hypothetical protein